MGGRSEFNVIISLIKFIYKLSIRSVFDIALMAYCLDIWNHRINKSGGMKVIYIILLWSNINALLQPQLKIFTSFFDDLLFRRRRSFTSKVTLSSTPILEKLFTRLSTMKLHIPCICIVSGLICGCNKEVKKCRQHHYHLKGMR